MQPQRASQTSGARTRRAKQAAARLGQHELWRGPASAQTLRPQHSSGPQLQPREPQGGNGRCQQARGKWPLFGAFVAAQLQLTRAKQDRLLQGIRTLPDLQSAWLLLLFCASPRCTHVLRALPPVASLAFAESHDAAIAACVVDLLGTGPLPDSALQIAQLPFQQGGLNLRSGVALAPAAYWASWADTQPVLHRQLPTLAGEILARLRAREPAGPALSGVLQAQDALTTAGFRPPSWEDLLDNPAPPSSLDLSGHLPEPSARGWQAPAATAIAEQLQAALLPQLDAASQALLFSQTGPFSSRSFCSVPSCPELTFPSDHLRALLLRRLRLPLPLSARSCRCRRPLDPLGDHRAACARSDALRSRGCPLERAAARVCREAGARVTWNTLVRDLNVAVARFDDRRIEVIANGLPLWNSLRSTRPLCRRSRPTVWLAPCETLPAPSLCRRHGAGLHKNSACR